MCRLIQKPTAKVVQNILMNEKKINKTAAFCQRFFYVLRIKKYISGTLCASASTV